MSSILDLISFDKSVDRCRSMTKRYGPSRGSRTKSEGECPVHVSLDRGDHRHCPHSGQGVLLCCLCEQRVLSQEDRIEISLRRELVKCLELHLIQEELGI